jgi:hypothetical protein
VGGVIIGTNENVEFNFAWSLGRASNNQVGEYALLQGVQLAKEIYIHKLIILGYSMNVNVLNLDLAKQ